MKYRSIKDWPEDERPRERLLRFGANELSTAQLMAIVLGTGGKEKSALELSREILAEFKTLGAVEDASEAEFSNIKGIGVAKIAQLKSALELGRRHIADKNTQRPCFKNSRQVFDYYMPRFYGLKKERFLCSLLDSRNRLVKETVISEGTLTSSPVHPREVFRYAIKEAAASVIFVHNHPSGDPDPSTDDIAITKRLVKTGKIIGIHVLDHVIIGDGRYSSVMEKSNLNL